MDSGLVVTCLPCVCVPCGFGYKERTWRDMSLLGLSFSWTALPALEYDKQFSDLKYLHIYVELTCDLYSLDLDF